MRRRTRANIDDLVMLLTLAMIIGIGVALWTLVSR